MSVNVSVAIPLFSPIIGVRLSACSTKKLTMQRIKHNAVTSNQLLQIRTQTVQQILESVFVSNSCASNRSTIWKECHKTRSYLEKRMHSMSLTHLGKNSLWTHLFQIPNTMLRISFLEADFLFVGKRGQENPPFSSILNVISQTIERT